MDKSKRRVVIAGNWKMNMGPAETPVYAATLAGMYAGVKKDAAVDVAVCVPFISVTAAAAALEGSGIKLGAQNVHWENKGAFTGEVSPSMLRQAGAEYAIIGHSERRQYFGETDAGVNRRALAALAGGLKVIICVGEREDERDAGITDELVAMQLKLALRGVAEAQLSGVVIAYEPVWAIGTGRTATAEEAGRVCGVIRRTAASLYGKAAAEGLTIQYGGSMNAANAAELLAQRDVDGGLIGGASLKAEDFMAIVRAAMR